jgi:biopolymer transport protein ExbB/TolQ
MIFDPLSSLLVASGIAAPAGEGVYYAFKTCDTMEKSIVFLLFLGSIAAWTIMIEKGIVLYRAKKTSELFMADFRKRRFPMSAIRDSAASQSPVARVFEKGAHKLVEYYDIPPEQAEFCGSAQYPVKKLSGAEIESVRAVLESEVTDQILGLEDKMGLLATAVSISPFLGLFGTVWGVMLAFCGLAITGKADIGTLAPGVAGALLATVSGLLVAIPSLIGYNLLTITVRKITVYMDNFVEEFMTKIKLEQIDAKVSK